MKYRKHDLIQMITVLEKANQQTRTADFATLNSMKDKFIECQSIAIDLGTYLETLDMNTRFIVEPLEDYCEALYQQSEYISDVSLQKKIYKKINKLLNQVKNAIKYDLPNEKKEIIFLPYKAAMWDSLESIWQAAREDKNCNVSVIPIPYFDRNGDGSFGMMHDEKDAYPDYVPIVSWNEYNVEEHRPDIAYVHNPYDDCNYVTCIHPNFFATRLKQSVGQLVYIPYFTAVKNQTDAHLCILPVPLLADKIIVQSEPIKQIYINELAEYRKQNHIEGNRNLDEKIIALGSPKYDKMLAFTQMGEKSVPLEWESLIYKADGCQKKVVFYNASLAVLLRENDKALEKMERVFRLFQVIRQDVVLLWRPHPLFLATLRSMRPDLEHTYLKLIEMYKKMKWGIFDDSNQFERAVHISDFCYGDPSSVADVFQAAGKGVLIQNVASDEEKLFLLDKFFLSPQKIFCCDENENIFFFSEYALYCRDSVNKETKFLFDFNNVFDCRDKISQVSQMAIVFNHIYFFARNSDTCGIVIYDRFENSYQVITTDFERTCDKKDVSSGLSYCIVFNQQIYFIPSYSGKALVKVFPINHTIQYIDGWDMALESQVKKKRRQALSHRYGLPILKNNKLVIPVAFQSFLMEYSFEKNQSYVISLDNVPIGIGTLCDDNTGYWMTSCDGNMLMHQTAKKLNIINLEEMALAPLPNIYDIGIGIAFCFHMNGYIWVLHRYSDKIAKIDVDNYSITYIPINICEYPYSQRKDWYFYMALQHHDSIFAFHGKGNVILKLNTITEKTEYFPLEVSMKPTDDEWIQFIKTHCEDLRILNKGEFFTPDNGYETIGKKIHDYILKHEEV